MKYKILKYVYHLFSYLDTDKQAKYIWIIMFKIRWYIFCFLPLTLGNYVHSKHAIDRFFGGRGSNLLNIIVAMVNRNTIYISNCVWMFSVKEEPYATHDDNL